MDIFIAYIVLGTTCTSVIFLYKYVINRHFNRLSRDDLTQRAIGWSLLWPILIFYSLPKIGLNTLFDKHEDFGFSGSIEKRQAELLSLWESPPYCSNFIETRGYDESAFEELASKLQFDACDIRDYLNELGPRSEFNVMNQDAIILKWINNRNTDSYDISRVPEELDRFSNTANSLLFKGIGKAYCEECQVEYLANQLNCISDKLSPGWNFKRLECCRGHLLSKVKGIHLNCRPK